MKTEYLLVLGFLLCRSLLGSGTTLDRKDEMICAGEEGKDTCQGDSGGPAVCQGEKYPVICGVISQGLGCGRPGFPGILTKVSDYIGWIEKIQKDSDRIKQIDEERIIMEREKCSTDNFYCSSKRRCQPRSFICDQDLDCESQDERDCEYIHMSPCEYNKFRCNNGICIRRGLVCNGRDDCGDSDSSDEAKCPTPCKKCTDGHQCGIGGRCIPSKWKCDGDKDCDDDSDEKDCNTETQNEIDTNSQTYTTTKPTSPCDGDKFFCLALFYQSNCIPLRWRCDGFPDCEYDADEIDCPVQC